MAATVIPDDFLEQRTDAESDDAADEGDEEETEDAKEAVPAEAAVVSDGDEDVLLREWVCAANGCRSCCRGEHLLDLIDRDFELGARFRRSTPPARHRRVRYLR